MNKIIDQLKNKKWRKRGSWHHSVIWAELGGRGECTQSQQKLGFPFKKTLTVWLDNGDFLDLQDEWDQGKKILKEEYKKNKKYLLEYAEKCLEHGNALIEYSRKNQVLDVSDYTDQELISLSNESYQKSIDFLPYMYSLHLFDEFLTKRFETLLREYIKNKKLPEKSYYDYHIALTRPYKKIFVLEEKESLLKLAIKVKKGLDIDGEEVKTLLQKHTGVYGWINAVLLEKEPYTVDYFRDQLNTLLKTDVEKEYNQMKEDEKHLREEQEKYMEKIEDQEELLLLAKTVQVFGFVRSFRVDVPYMALGYHWNLFTEIGKRLSVEPLMIKYLDSKEVEDSLLKKRNDYKKLIEDRKKGFISVMIDDQHYEISEGIEEIKKHVSLPQKVDEDFVKGTIAFPGVFEGTAKVLHEVDDMKKIEKGDVLIISMTDPNFIPAMEKAGAFVTDMGGILCHAAIVSREMKKPCIIGTKNATQVFKDGDTLLVDAENGIVKKSGRVSTSNAA